MDTHRTTLKLWHALAALALLLALYAAVLYPWMMRWGATDAELRMALPGDELVPHVSYMSTRAITIHAPAAEVWQWLVQVGQGKAGFYSNDWLENLFLADIHNANQLHAEWQGVKQGDLVLGTTPNYLGGVLGPGLGWRVPVIQPGRAIYLWGPAVLIPVDDHTTRLIMRSPNGPMAPALRVMMGLSYDPIHFVMERGMMLGLRDHAEGNAQSSPLLWLAALAGWTAAALGTACLLFLRRRGWWWGLLPAALAVAVLTNTGDLRAASAGFVALGLTIGGFLAYGRRWWPGILLIAAGVLLVLLLVEDSWFAFGILFLVAGLALAIYDALQNRNRSVGARVSRPA